MLSECRKADAGIVNGLRMSQSECEALTSSVRLVVHTGDTFVISDKSMFAPQKDFQVSGSFSACSKPKWLCSKSDGCLYVLIVA